MLTVYGQKDPGSVDRSAVDLFLPFDEDDVTPVDSGIRRPDVADLDRRLLQEADPSLVGFVDVGRIPVELNEDGNVLDLPSPRYKRFDVLTLCRAEVDVAVED